MSQWITEEQTPHLRLSAEAEEVLYSGESEFQKIEVFKSKEYGTMLALDGVFQTSEREEFIYHEMMSHVPLFLHPNPERVLIIGGGDWLRNWLLCNGLGRKYCTTMGIWCALGKSHKLV